MTMLAVGRDVDPVAGRERERLPVGEREHGAPGEQDDPLVLALVVPETPRRGVPPGHDAFDAHGVRSDEPVGQLLFQ